MATLPNEETMVKMAELVVDSVRQRLMDEYGDLIHDSIGDAIIEVLGEDAHEEFDESDMYHIMSDLTSRVTITAA